MNLASIEAIFSEALEIPTAEARAAYLDRACAADPELRRQVESLIDVHDRAGRFLASPTVSYGSGSPEPVGSSVGPYKLREQIGEGGMGVVYVAEQTHPVRRKVALKIIKPGMDTKQVIARFESERQALALMDHPNIARVLDGGSTDDGRPYFVMELVRGMPITDYCDAQKLTIRERLELFVLVCRAVQHAHQKGIIHRDLKPANILVTLHDGVPVPKVIDFGVAKATGQALTDKTVYTAFMQLVGTPLYMSPEQVELSGLDMDTRSDIYSLGVLLYELLTGTTPFDSETLKRAAFDEVRRIIREQEPPRPSTRLSSLGATRTTVSANRQADARQLDRSVRGELDWIVMKALEKDRRRRYETANDFASDVMRYLTDQPVEACPPSVGYRFSKYARRHRVALTTATLVGLALVAGTAVSLWQATKARAAAAEARLRADESKQVIDYLANDVFGAAAPGKGRGRSMTLGELLDQADATVAERFRRQPLVEASVRMALAQSCYYLGDVDRSVQHAARAAELRMRQLGPEHPATLEALAGEAWCLCNAGWAFGREGMPKSAEPIARRVLAARHRVLGPTHPDTLWSQVVLAATLGHLGRHAEAEPLAAQAEQLAVRALGPEHETTLWARHFLGALIADGRGDLARAEVLIRQALAGRERNLGILDHLTIHTLGSLGDVVRRRGRTDEARLLFLESIDRSSRLFGLCHVQTEWQWDHLMSLLHSKRDYAAIRDLCERWLREILASPIDPDPHQRSRRTIVLGHLALTLTTLPAPVAFDVELAVLAARQAAELDKGWYGRTILGAFLCRRGRLDEALHALKASAQQPDWAGGNDLYWFTLAVIHARRGDLARAGECYERGRDPDTSRDTWTRTETIDAVRAEAEALIHPKPPPTPQSEK